MSDNTPGDSQAELMLVLHMIPNIQFPIIRIEHTPTSVRITEVEGANFNLRFHYKFLGNVLSGITGIVNGKQIDYSVTMTMSGCIKKIT